MSIAEKELTEQQLALSRKYNRLCAAGKHREITDEMREAKRVYYKILYRARNWKQGVNGTSEGYEWRGGSGWVRADE